ncbi:MAG: DegT/DnrJ/EryC1/StrS family aminotransferase, partial [Ottowia sp.]|nr:DegT/DnrJ/EryC1/StrS family aminotransferase [Ottowia sp.]
HGIGVGNGTDALMLALLALDARPGQRVLTAANAGFYSSTAIARVGAVAHYVEVDENSLTLSVPAVQEALKEKEKPAALIVTHLYGRMADMLALTEICAAAGVPIVEDVAQAHGAQLGGRKAGSWGALGCFSFYPTKNLGAIGDGGLVTTSDETLAQRLRALRQYGWQQRKYEVALSGGMNSRLDELQAAVLLDKLSRLGAANAARREIAVRYNAAFSGLPLRCPPDADASNVVHLYVVRSAQRDALRTHLQERGIGCDVHYPIADHLQPVYGGNGGVSLPISERACAEVLSLPCYPGLDAAQQQRVIDAVRDFYKGGNGC